MSDNNPSNRSSQSGSLTSGTSNPSIEENVSSHNDQTIKVVTDGNYQYESSDSNLAVSPSPIDIPRQQYNSLNQSNRNLHQGYPSGKIVSRGKGPSEGYDKVDNRDRPKQREHGGSPRERERDPQLREIRNDMRVPNKNGGGFRNNNQMQGKGVGYNQPSAGTLHGPPYSSPGLKPDGPYGNLMHHPSGNYPRSPENFQDYPGNFPNSGRIPVDQRMHPMPQQNPMFMGNHQQPAMYQGYPPVQYTIPQGYDNAPRMPPVMRGNHLGSPQANPYYKIHPSRLQHNEPMNDMMRGMPQGSVMHGLTGGNPFLSQQNPNMYNNRNIVHQRPDALSGEEIKNIAPVNIASSQSIDIDSKPKPKFVIKDKDGKVIDWDQKIKTTKVAHAITQAVVVDPDNSKDVEEHREVIFGKEDVKEKQSSYIGEDISSNASIVDSIDNVIDGTCIAESPIDIINADGIPQNCNGGITAFANISDDKNDAEEEDWETDAANISSGIKSVVISSNEYDLADLKKRSDTTSVDSSITSNESHVRLVYSRETILSMKALITASCERPKELLDYANISKIENNHSNNSTPTSTPSKASDSSTWSGNRSSVAGSPSLSSSSPSKVGSPITSNAEIPWKRESIQSLPHPPPVTNPKSKKNQTPIAMPKKVVTDPLEILTADIRSILNKITPQTFEKLSGQIKDMKIPNRKGLNRLVELIFEKAIYEQSFSNLYAELCYDLERQISTWSFINIIYNRESNQYYWIVDLDVDPLNQLFAGPFNSITECLHSSTLSSLPPLRSLPYRLVLQSLTQSNGILHKIYKNFSNSQEEQFFVNYIPIQEVLSSHQVAEQRFATKDDADKNSKKKNSVKSTLLTLCEKEFFCSASKQDKYSVAESAIQELKKNRSSMSATEIEQEELRIEEIQDKLKRRILGCIRFIGELFKKGLVMVSIMHVCIDELLCVTSSNEVNSMGRPLFKSLPAELDLEVLCKLVRTVGQTLESKSTTPENMKIFNSYFQRISELSQDKKNLSSRIRFSLDEICILRKNCWKERRVEEGPEKIEELRRKMENEYRASHGLPPLPINANISSSTTQKSSNNPTNSNRMQNQVAGNKNSISGRNASNSGNPVHVQRGPSHPRSLSQDNTLTKPDATSSPSLSHVAAPPLLLEEDRKLVRITVDDYLCTGTFEDVSKALQDRNVYVIASFVMAVITKYIVNNEHDVHMKLLDLLKKCSNVLIPARQSIWTAITDFEQLQLLSDYVVDSHLAPELFGQIIGTLISIQIVELSQVREFVKAVRKNNLEFADASDVDQIYSRLIDSAIKYSA